MANKLATLLVLLIIILREAGQTQLCGSSCPSVCNCVGMGYSRVPRNLPRTITSLKLSHNSITNLRRNGFSLYSKLKELNLSNNKISKVHKMALTLSYLQKLHLSNNKITYIQPGTFSCLPRLQDLYLNGNKITNIDPGTFSCLPGIFSCLSNLRSLNLSNNKITKIPLGTFRNLTTLSCLSLNFNNLTTVLPGTFTNLKYLRSLSLHNNQITDIKTGTFSDLPRLRFYELSSNQICDIQPGAFSRLPTFIDIRLEQNHLTSILPGTFSNLTKLKEVRLDENPWHCDCRMVGVRKTFEFNNKITCQEPSNLHGRKLDEIDPNDLICKKPKIVRFENIKGNRLVPGETLHLVCAASGIPTPDITVTLPSGLNATVESSGRVTVGVNGTFTITNVTAADAGKYICTAGNLIGFACVNIFVVIETPTSAMPVVSTGLVETSDVIVLTSAAHTDGMMFKRLRTSDGQFVEVETITSVMSGLSTAAHSDGMMSKKPAIVRFKKKRQKKAHAPSAPTIDTRTDDVANKSLNTSGDQVDAPEKVYEDPESLVAILASPLKGAVDPKEESVGMSDLEDEKLISMPKKEAEAASSNNIGPDGHEKAAAANSDSSHENRHVKETDHGNSHVTENTVKDEAVLYAQEFASDDQY
ncbi:uncharacterized protein LOC144877395 [Branchiostoma floridae x Branchiostoma japonicum]